MLGTGEVSGRRARTAAQLDPDEAEGFDQMGNALADAATRLPVDTFGRRVREGAGNFALPLVEHSRSRGPTVAGGRRVDCCVAWLRSKEHPRLAW